jgi:LPXTG-motif cell wall-anchored protein
MLLGLGFVAGSVMSNQTWAAILGFVVMAGGLYVLTRKPNPTESNPSRERETDGDATAAAVPPDVDPS